MSRRLLRFYRWGDRALEAAVEHARGAWDGAWLGVLDDDALGVVDEQLYDATELYRSESWNRRGLTTWEADLVQRHVPEAAQVVVMGAGGGREVLALLARGHDATGWEPNAGLVEAAEKFTAADGHGRRVSACSRHGWPAPAGSADAVLYGWGAYMLIVGRAARIRSLRGAAATVREHGPVVVSYFRMPARRRQFRTAYRVASLLRRLRRAEAPVLGDALEPNYAHHFTRRQIEHEFAAAGLQLVDIGAADRSYGWAVGRRPAPAGGWSSGEAETDG